MWRLRSIRRLTWLARGYLVEALVSLSVARLALKVFSFERLTRFFNQLPRTTLSGAKRDEVRAHVRWAIKKASRHLPGDTVCFPQAIAAQAMLRRRGISTTLYYGAITLPTRELKAHVWLQDGSIGIVGHEAAREYHILAQYPQPSAK